MGAMRIGARQRDGNDAGVPGVTTSTCAEEKEVEMGSEGRSPNGAIGMVAGTAGLQISVPYLIHTSMLFKRQCNCP